MIVDKNKLKNTLVKVYTFSNGTGLAGLGTKVLLNAKDGKVTLTAYDGSNFGSFSFDNEKSPEGELEFVTEHKYLVAAASTRGDVDFSFENKKLTVVQNETVMVYPASTSEAFSLVEKELEDDSSSIKIDSSVLKKIISKVSYARKEHDEKPFVAGVNLKFDGKKLEALATDRVKVLRSHEVLEGFNDINFDGILTDKCIRAIENMDDSMEISLSMDKKAVKIVSGSMKIFVPKLDAVFPDVDIAFKITENVGFILDKGKVLEAIDILSTSSNKALTLCHTGDDARLVFKIEDGVTAIKDVIYMEECTGGDFKMSIDFELFKNIFKNLKDCNLLRFSFEGELKALKFTDMDNFEGVAMPLRG